MISCWSPGFVQVSTLCVTEGIIAAGGFGGELVCKRLEEQATMYSGRVTLRCAIILTGNCGIQKINTMQSYMKRSFSCSTILNFADASVIVKRT